MITEFREVIVPIYRKTFCRRCRGDGEKNVKRTLNKGKGVVKVVGLMYLPLFGVGSRRNKPLVGIRAFIRP